MGLFSKPKPLTGLDAVQQYSKRVSADIDEANRLLDRVDHFDPKNSKHVKLAKAIMAVAIHLPETRMADIRNSDWAESRHADFKIQSRTMEASQWFSQALKILYKDQVVLDWEHNSDSNEYFRIVRLGPWCASLFETVRAVRKETEDRVRQSEIDEQRRITDFESVRYSPFNPG